MITQFFEILLVNVKKNNKNSVLNRLIKNSIFLMKLEGSSTFFNQLIHKLKKKLI